MISQNSCRTRNDYSRSLARRPVGGRPLVISNSVFTRIKLNFSFAELSVVHSHSVNEFWLDEGEYKRIYVSYVCVKCAKVCYSNSAEIPIVPLINRFFVPLFQMKENGHQSVDITFGIIMMELLLSVKSE